MSLCCMNELLLWAKNNNCAVGSFSVSNMEMIIGALRASEETNTPIIIQIAESRLKSSPLELIAPMMIAAAKHAKTKVAVHFDHGITFEKIYAAVNNGFTSVMYDGSKLPIDENIKNVRSIKNEVGKLGVAVEAELGIMGKDENGNISAKSTYTDPNDVTYFVNKAKPDALAVAIGNSHGLYKGVPDLRFDILEKIRDITDVPLVLHGGTGISPKAFRQCIDLGVKKINIATANFISFVKGARDYSNYDKLDYFDLDEYLISRICDNIKQHIKIFNNKEEI